MLFLDARHSSGIEYRPLPPSKEVFVLSQSSDGLKAEATTGRTSCSADSCLAPNGEKEERHLYQPREQQHRY
jgi:hypothetical protein